MLTFDEKNEELAKIVAECPLLKEGSYQSPKYLFGGFMESIFATSVRPKHLLPRIRETFTIPAFKKPEKATCCPDEIPEGIISVDWIHSKNDSKAIAILVPGLTGCSTDCYMQVLSDTLAKEDITVACFNPRSRGGNKLISPFLYSAGYTEDLRWLVKQVKSKNPSKPLVGVGFSLGANYLTKYLGEEGKDCVLSSAYIVGGPLDSLKNSAYLSRNWITRTCDSYLAKSIMKLLSEFEGMIKTHPLINIDLAKKAKTIHDVDEHLTSKTMGYKTADEYYVGCSSLPFVPLITIPTLFVSSLNDPIIHYVNKTLPEFTNNKNLIRFLVQSGGHSLTYPKAPFGKKSWMAEVGVSFFKSSLKF